MQKILISIIILSFSSLVFAQSAEDLFNVSIEALENKDFVKAANLSKQACEGEIAKACYNLGFLYFKGLGVKKDYKQAMDYFEVACEHDVFQGCFNAGYMYQGGYGVEFDYTSASSFYHPACDNEIYEACTNLGTLYESGGFGISQNKNMAKYLFKKSCENGENIACERFNGINKKTANLLELMNP